MSSLIYGEVYPNVKVGKRAQVSSDAIVKSGEIPKRGYIVKGDVVEKAYAYPIKGSHYPITVTQKYLCVGCVPIPLDLIDDITENEILMGPGKAAVKWYRKFYNQFHEIADKHKNNRMP